MRLILICLLALITVLITVLIPARASRAQDIAVDLELVLAIDSSRSVDRREFNLQIKGIATAFRDPAFLSALRNYAPRGIAVALVQWSGQKSHINVVGWQFITNESSARAFANQVDAAGRRLAPGSTSINNAIGFSSAILRDNGYRGARQVIDVSGDGYNNTGNRPELTRDRAVARGITINGLTITNEVARLDRYFRDRVIGGPGAFVMKALDYRDFAAVFNRKLIREVIGDNVYSMKQD